MGQTRREKGVTSARVVARRRKTARSISESESSDSESSPPFTVTRPVSSESHISRDLFHRAQRSVQRIQLLLYRDAPCSDLRQTRLQVGLMRMHITLISIPRHLTSMHSAWERWANLKSSKYLALAARARALLPLAQASRSMNEPLPSESGCPQA